MASQSAPAGGGGGGGGGYSGQGHRHEYRQVISGQNSLTTTDKQTDRHTNKYQPRCWQIHRQTGNKLTGGGNGGGGGRGEGRGGANCLRLLSSLEKLKDWI